MIQQSKVSAINASTLKRIPKYLDEFVFNHLESGIRLSTENLLDSIYKIGSKSERHYIIKQISQRINNLEVCGHSASNVLNLIARIIMRNDNTYAVEEVEIIENLKSILIRCFNSLLNNKQYGFLKFCEDQIDYGNVFKPHIFELNGCMKCYGTIENNMTASSRKIEQICEEIKIIGNKIQYRLKRRYELKDVTLLVFNKNTSSKPYTIAVWYADTNNNFVKYGTYNPQEPIALTTSVLQIEFENLKPSRYSCQFCNSKSQQTTIICSNCKKGLEIDLRYKTISGDGQKIMKQINESCNNLKQIKKKIFDLYKSVSRNTRIKNQHIDIKQMEKVYGQIMLNFNLINDISNKQVSDEYSTQLSKDACLSCKYLQVINLLKFFSNLDLVNHVKICNIQTFVSQSDSFLHTLVNLFYQAQVSDNLSNQLAQCISIIILGVYKHFNLETLFSEHPDKPKYLKLIKRIYVTFKLNDNAFLEEWFFNKISNQNLTVQNRIQLLVVRLLKKHQLQLLPVADLSSSDKLKQIKRLTVEQMEPYKQILSYDKQIYLKLDLTNDLILLLCLLPHSLLPQIDIDIVDESIIPLLKISKIPTFNKKVDVILSPHQMIPLGYFQILPSLAKFLAPELGVELIKQILKFKKIWNSNLYSTLDSCDYLIETLDKETQLRMCLQGLISVDEEFFIYKIENILVPKRKQFIIRIDIPEKEIKNYSRINQEQLDYPMIKTRELKTEELTGDTMKEVHDWIMKQLKVAMPMDLYVEGKIVDDLSVPIEMIFKKIVKSEDKKSVGNHQYDYFKVVYRVRGYFGEPTEQLIGNLGDEQRQKCLSYAPILVEPLNKQGLCGLDIIFRIYKLPPKSNIDKVTKKSILKILHMVFNDQNVRIKAIQKKYADILVRATLFYLSYKDQESSQMSDTLLETVSKLIDQANNFIVNNRKASERKNSVDMEIEQDRTVEIATKNVKLVLERIKGLDENRKTKHLTQLIKILPFCSKDNPQLSAKLYDFLAPHEAYQKKDKQSLQNLYVFLQALPETYINFKRICYEKNLVAFILESLKEIFPTIETITEKSLNQNDHILVINFTILKNLLKGFEDIHRDLLETNTLIPVIHKISVSVCKNTRILTYAQEIIKYLANSNIVEEVTSLARELVDKYQLNKKKRGEAIKKAKFEEMKLKMQKNNAVEKIKIENMVCAICQQGYENKNSLLGFYIYSSKTEIHNIQNWWYQFKKTPSVTSVTFFTPIHYQCHKKAQEYDVQQHKNQWDGALIRNSEAKCNNWIPLKGPNTQDQEFDKISRKYFEHNKNGTAWTVVNDLKGLLQKFAYQENFSKQSKGSAHHNSKLIPVLLLFAVTLFKKYPDQYKVLSLGVSNLDNKDVDNVDTLLLYMTCGLFVVSYKESSKFIDDNIAKIHSLLTKLKLEENLENCRPFYVMLCILKEVFRIIHSKIETKDLLVSLEQYMCRNHQSYFKEFEKLADTYKNDYLKRSSVEDLSRL